MWCGDKADGHHRSQPQRPFPSCMLYATLGVTLLVLSVSQLLSSNDDGTPTRLLLLRAGNAATASGAIRSRSSDPVIDPATVQPGKLSLPPVVIASADQDDTFFMASPSITKLPDGRLLSVGLQSQT